MLESDVVFYLLNAHIQTRKIWLCVHGETDFDAKGILSSPLVFLGVLLLNLLVRHIVKLATIQVPQQVAVVNLLGMHANRHYAVFVLHRTHGLVHTMTGIT